MQFSAWNCSAKESCKKLMRHVHGSLSRADLHSRGAAHVGELMKAAKCFQQRINTPEIEKRSDVK
jgi:hypothetical protein